jgi:tetratricopeptide (TPR) repeat protein
LNYWHLKIKDIYIHRILEIEIEIDLSRSATVTYTISEAYTGDVGRGVSCIDHRNSMDSHTASIGEVIEVGGKCRTSPPRFLFDQSYFRATSYCSLASARRSKKLLLYSLPFYILLLFLLLISISSSLMLFCPESLKAQSAELDRDFLLEEGNAAYDQGNYTVAMQYYDKALIIDPNFVEALSNKGLALDNLGRSEEAIQYYDKALVIDPDFVDALNNKGDLYYYQGNYTEALQYFDKALAAHR